MTKFEKSQPRETFLSAGRNAFLLMIHPDDNPYRDEPYRKYWADGYRRAKREFNARKFKALNAEQRNEEKNKAASDANRNIGQVLRRGLANGPFRRDDRQQRSRKANRPQRQGNAVRNLAVERRSGGQ